MAQDYSSHDGVIQGIFDAVNGPSAPFERRLRERFARLHPTLQQAVIRHAVKPLLEVMAAEQYPDDRNRHAKVWAELALAATDGERLPTI